MKGFRESIRKGARLFAEWLKRSDKEDDKRSYRGVSYAKSDNIPERERKLGNNKMSYRGVSYRLLNSKIKV